MAQFQVGKQMIKESTMAFDYQVGPIYVLESGIPLQDVQQSLIFTQDANGFNLSQDISQNLIFTQTIGLVAPKERIASDTVNFTDTAIGVSHTFNVSQSLIFNHSSESTNPNPIERSESQNLIFAQTALSSTYEDSLTQTILFTQTVNGVLLVEGIERTITQTIIFNDTATSVFISVDAIACDAEDTVNFTDRVALPITIAAFNNVIFTQTASTTLGKFVEQTVFFSGTITLEQSLTRTITQTVVFRHYFVYELGDPDLCFYAPLVGSGTFPSAPVLTKKDFVTLFWPTTSPTITLQIRAPEFGDRDRLQHDKINRETRGGSLKIFADTTWPKLQILEMQFIALKETEAQSLLDFFEDTLGLLVGFTDWENRTWHGVIVSPEREIVRSKRNSIDVAFEFEGELQ